MPHIPSPSSFASSRSTSYDQVLALGGLISLFILHLDLRRRRLTLREIFGLPLLAALDVWPSIVIAGWMFWSLIHALLRGQPFTAPISLTLISSLATLPVLWIEGRKQIQFQRPVGLVFAEWIVMMGCLWLVVTAVFRHTAVQRAYLGLWAILPILIGVTIVAVVVPPFYRKYEGLRILAMLQRTSSSRSRNMRQPRRNVRVPNYGACLTPNPPN
jgi:hypothetical protein